MKSSGANTNSGTFVLKLAIVHSDTEVHNWLTLWPPDI